MTLFKSLLFEPPQRNQRRPQFWMKTITSKLCQFSDTQILKRPKKLEVEFITVSQSIKYQIYIDFIFYNFDHNSNSTKLKEIGVQTEDLNNTELQRVSAASVPAIPPVFIHRERIQIVYNIPPDERKFVESLIGQIPCRKKV